MKYISDELLKEISNVFMNIKLSRDTSEVTLNNVINKIYSISIQKEPQFQNGDTVYDDDGIELTYIAPHPHYPELSVISNSGFVLPIRTDRLTKTPPVTPKDGEWWMCEIDHVNGIMSCVLKFTGNRWFTLYNEDNTLEYHGQQIKPLYRMIRDTNTDTE